MAVKRVLRGLGKTLWYLFTIPASVLASSIFLLLLPWKGLESMATGEDYAFSPFGIALGLILWTYLARATLAWRGVTRLTTVLVLIIGVQAAYFWFLAACWDRLMADASPADFASAGLQDAWLNVFYCAAALGAAILFGRSGYRHLQTRRHIELLSATPPSGIAYGLCEVVGRLTTEGAHALIAPVSGVRCLAWWSFEKRRRKDSTYWHTTGFECVPLYCSDDTQRVALDFRQAEFSGGVWSEDASGQRAERVVPLDSEVYVLGEARIDPQTGDTLRISAPTDAPIAMKVSTDSEAELVGQIAEQTANDFSACLTALSCAAMLSFPFFKLTEIVFFQLATFVPPALVVGMLGFLFANDLLMLRNRVRRNRANIEVSLKKRADLWPRLDACARRMIVHDQDIMQRVALLRGQRAEDLVVGPGESKNFPRQEPDPVDRLLALVERHPDLRAEDALRNVLRQYVMLENEVTRMIDAYNGAVTQYHDRRDRISGRLLGAMLRLKHEPFYSPQAAPRAMPAYLREQDV